MTSRKARSRSRKEERAIFAKGHQPRMPRKVPLARAKIRRSDPREFGRIASIDGWTLQRARQLGMEADLDVTQVVAGWQEGRILHTTGPHAEHRVRLVEDRRNVQDRIYEITDSHGTRIGFLGSEWASLAKAWSKERKRRGIDEDPDDLPTPTYPAKTVRDGKVVTKQATVPGKDPPEVGDE